MIEKNIFQTWNTKNLPSKIQEKINSFLQLNPGYEYKLYDDKDMDYFVNEYYKGEIADCYNKLNIIVAKADFWRYLIIYKYGGIYLDMDSCIEKNLSELIKDEDEAIITAEGNPNIYVQWCLIFKKEHPILKRTIEIVVDNIKNNKYPNNIMRMTGPIAFTEAINQIHKELFNNEIIDHSKITKNTDITYKLNNISYRIYGIDFSGYCCWKHNCSHLLYINKKHWTQEEKEKKLLK